MNLLQGWDSPVHKAFDWISQGGQFQPALRYLGLLADMVHPLRVMTHTRIGYVLLLGVDVVKISAVLPLPLDVSL